MLVLESKKLTILGEIMNQIRKWLNNPLVGIVIAIVSQLGYVFYCLHTEGFQFISKELKSSPVIESITGKVKSVKIYFPFTFKQRQNANVGDYGELRAVGYVAVIGEKKTIFFLYVDAKKSNHIWHLNDVEWDGNKINIHPYGNSEQRNRL